MVSTETTANINRIVHVWGAWDLKRPNFTNGGYRILGEILIKKYPSFLKNQ